MTIKNYKIFIHPGHGGVDSGAIGPTGLKEKDVALDISKKVRVILEKHNQTVQLARETDISLNSGVAANNAIKWGADYVISIHCNSASNIKATGTETFSSKTNAKSISMSRAVQECLVKELKLPDRGNKTGNFTIITRPKVPSILVEVAFINNPKEEALLKTQEFRYKAAMGIAQGMLKFLNIKYLDNIVKVEYNKNLLLIEGIFQNDKNYIAIRDILEPLGFTLEWNGTTQTIIVKKK